MNSKISLGWISLFALLVILPGCGGGGTSSAGGTESLPSPVPDSFEGGIPVWGDGGSAPVSEEELALRPRVHAGYQQFADPNVLVTLQGSVEPAEGAEISRILWIQIAGPSVEIPEPEGLTNLILAPLVDQNTLLEFRLIAQDSEGRINSASVSIVVRPTAGQLAVQSIGFELPGPFQLLPGATFINPLDPSIVPAGTGDIVYRSSNPAVATVDATGMVTALSVGSTRISVIKEGDTQYRAAAASYDLVVILPQSVDINIFVGSLASNIRFPNNTDNYLFIRSRDIECDLSNYEACDNGQADVLEDDSWIADPALTLESTAYYWLDMNGYISNPLEIVGNTDGFRIDAPPARYEHGLLSFNDRLWLIGGAQVDLDEMTEFYDDVWTSIDGVSWERIATNIVDPVDRPTPFYSLASAVVYNNRLWTLDNDTGELYSSADGMIWEKPNTQPMDEPRYSHQLLVFQEQLLLIGMHYGDAGSLFEIWSYDDTDGWGLLPDTIQFTDVYGAKAVVFDNRLWLIGSIYEDGVLTNPTGIWSSADGIDWVPEDDSDANFGNRYGHQLAVFNDVLWLIGGAADGYPGNEVWWSDDGLSWNLALTQAEFEIREYFQLTEFNGLLWLYGGLNYSSDTPTLRDTWVTQDGIDWKRVYRGSISFDGDMN